MLTQNLRESLLPTVDSLARRVGLYAAYTLDPLEYIGDLESEEAIREAGYEYNGLSALKYHPDTGEPDHGSFRKVDQESPRWQYHIHFWDRGSYLEVWSHYELRPDFTEPDVDLERLRRHYRPNYGEDYLRGVVCDDLKKVVY